MNRPFAVLKDLLPPELLPAEDSGTRGRKRHDASRRDAPADKGARPAKSARPGEARSRGDKSRNPQNAKAPGKPGKSPAEGHAARPAAEGGAHPPARPDHQGNRPARAAKHGKPAPAPREAAPPAETPEAIEQRRKAAERAEQQRALANEGITVLSERYPALFNRNQPVPLAIGIHKPLVEAAREGQLPVSVAAIRAAMGRWTGSWPYLAIMTEGAVRIDLDGNPAGTVDAEQAEAAKQTLTQRRSRQQPRRGKGKPAGKTAGKPAKHKAAEGESHAAAETAPAAVDAGARPTADDTAAAHTATNPPAPATDAPAQRSPSAGDTDSSSNDTSPPSADGVHTP